MEQLQGENESSPDIANDGEETIAGKGLKKNMGKILRATISELETALTETQNLLAIRDKEVAKLKSEVEQYKHQTAKEVANKTKLAQSLDESTRQAIELEGTLEKWQLSGRECQQQAEQLEAALMQERGHSVELERRFSELYAKKSKEVEQLTVQLIEARKKGPKVKLDSAAVDGSQMMFLKQAVYHLLIDSRPEEHLRAIVSILNFSVEERKTVYAKFQEKKGKTN